MPSTNHYADAAMCIRKPITLVFNAFIDPTITTQFWFTKSTGKLEEGKTVEWAWEMYGVSAPINVQTIVPNEKILISWGEDGQKSMVEWTFTAINETATYVAIKNWGFQGEGEDLISQIRDSTGGFTMVLAGLKAYLEHGIKLNLVGDKWPEEMR